MINWIKEKNNRHGWILTLLSLPSLIGWWYAIFKIHMKNPVFVAIISFIATGIFFFSVLWIYYKLFVEKRKKIKELQKLLIDKENELIKIKEENDKLKQEIKSEYLFMFGINWDKNINPICPVKDCTNPMSESPSPAWDNMIIDGSIMECPKCKARVPLQHDNGTHFYLWQAKELIISEKENRLVIVVINKTKKLMKYKEAKETGGTIITDEKEINELKNIYSKLQNNNNTI